MLSTRGKYLQIALNGTLNQAQEVIEQLPPSERILIEAGTPLLKRYGDQGIRKIKFWWSQKIQVTHQAPYIVADYKAMDRGVAEVVIAAQAGASAITVLGQAPVETINALIEACEKHNLDAIIDMMNVHQPYKVLRNLKKLPSVVMLHRGVDETERGTTRFPIHLINKVKGAFDVLVSIGGGDTIREVQSAFFNGADIVMLWKGFYQPQDNTAEVAKNFLKKIK